MMFSPVCLYVLAALVGFFSKPVGSSPVTLIWGWQRSSQFTRLCDGAILKRDGARSF